MQFDKTIVHIVRSESTGATRLMEFVVSRGVSGVAFRTAAKYTAALIPDLGLPDLREQGIQSTIADSGARPVILVAARPIDRTRQLELTMTAHRANSELEAERAYWQTRLANLEVILCDLLVKNERLRQKCLMFAAERPTQKNARTDS